MSDGNYSEGLLPQMLYVEKAFDPVGVQQWSDSIKSSSVWFSAIYLILIFAGQRWMRSRPPFDLRMILFLWNSLLSVFSIIGAIRTVPELYNGINIYGWTYSVCDASFYYGSTGFWAYAFTVSKAYELGDTLFVVLRRQPLIFLHWYHHISVMIYCFYSYPQHISSGRWYMVMNYCVHSIMYTYFALRALRVRVPYLIRMSVTSLQILQMASGLVVAVSVFLLKHSGVECHQTYFNVGATVLMYMSYLLLFGHFFYLQYAFPAVGRKLSSSVHSGKSVDLTEEQVKKLD